MMKRIAALLLTLAVALCAALPVLAAGTIEVTEDVSVSDDTTGPASRDKTSP